MVIPDQAAAPAVGACLRCNNIFLVTSSSSTCLLCGRPPDLTLPFGRVVYTEADAELEPLELAEEPLAAVPYAIKCPHCDKDVQLSITDTEISVMAASPLLPVDEAGSDSDPAPEPAFSPDETEQEEDMVRGPHGKLIVGPPAPPEPEAVEEPAA